MSEAVEPIRSISFIPGTSRVRIRWRNGFNREQRIAFLEQLKVQVRNELVVEKMQSYLEEPEMALSP